MDEIPIEIDNFLLDTAFLEKMVNTRMPFGKYTDRLIIDLPESYLIWFSGKGFPEGELGRMMGIMYVVRANGLEYLFEPLRGIKGP